MLRNLLTFSCVLLATVTTVQPASILSKGLEWKYSSEGRQPAAVNSVNWNQLGYPDAAWAQGNAELGYGDGDESTLVTFGPNRRSKYITTYFRKTFSVPELSSYSSVFLRLKWDDGAIIYLNGNEIGRFNMPSGQATYSTYAISAIEDTTDTITLSPTLFFETENVLAVEVHQATAGSSDLSFDLELIGEEAAAVGPYVNGAVIWKYFNQGGEPAAAGSVKWNQPGYTDGAWAQGRSELGFGDGGEATVVSYGPNANAKYITTYFRKTFSMPELSNYSSIELSLKRDDGAVVYLNGDEVGRFNMPGGQPTYATYAIASIEDTIDRINLSPGLFNETQNVLAVEVHQATANSSDLSFDLQLIGQTTAVHGPYVNGAADWKYWNQGMEPAAVGSVTWNQESYSDTGWAQGRSELGFGDGGEATVVSYGPNANAKYITTYFRKTFSMPELSNYSSIELSLKRDDGAVVYLNGDEVGRFNMPGGQPTYATYAIASIEDTIDRINLSPGLFNETQNVLAVEVHQATANSSDLSFDLQLIGQTTAVHGPYVNGAADWKYWNQGMEPSAAGSVKWNQPGYSDGAWAQGRSELGYGDGGEATVISYGPNASAKYITTYFRKTFSMPELSDFSSIELSLKRDDGAVVYLNGNEVGRFNMPTGQPTYSTYAPASIEDIVDRIELSPAQFNETENVLAVEVHQASASSSDLSFDLELNGQGGVLNGQGAVVRGPYLQMGTSTNVVVRWRTAFPRKSLVRFGTSPDPVTWAEVSSDTQTTEHEMNITGLQPNTGYYYSVNNPTPVVDSTYDYIFYTAPVPGSGAPVRIWALGDSGTADANAAAVRNAYYNFAPTDYTDLLLMLGDNAYNNGLDSEYQLAVFDMYPSILRQTVLWPTIGNHDTASSTTHNPDFPYFKIFTLPSQGESGGLPSGVENYYSFDYANIHFVCLDSMTSSRQPGSAMLNWLEQDLAANTLAWVIAFWHHPPYSKGNHDSDNSAEVQMIEMRKNVLPILDAYSVDLVLTGHSHSYERSYLLSGHYGFSSTLTPEMVLDDGSGRSNESGAYVKPTGLRQAREGAVYVVAGSSGKNLAGAHNHPAMFLSLNKLGSLVIDVNVNRLDLRFLRESGAIDDYFSIVKPE